VKSIKLQLLVWLLGGMLASTILAGSALYLQVQEEANELFDNHLQQVAQSFPGELATQPAAAEDEDIAEDILVQVWDRAGTMTYATRHVTALPRAKRAGFETTAVQDEQWRVYAMTRRELWIQVAQPLAVRQEIITGVALRSLLPFLLLIPVLAVLIGIVVERSLRPLQSLTAAIQQRSHQSLAPMLLKGMSPETQPMLDALNELLVRLDKAVALQRDFIADAAHALRTPLTALKLQLQLAQRAITDEERAAAFIKLTERLDRSIHLVQQLLILVREEAQPAQVGNVRVDLVSLAQQAVSENIALAVSKHIDLGVESESDQLEVIGEAAELLVLLGNLIDNAVRYTPSHGRVDVMACLCEGVPTLKVVDNGPGVPAEERARVLDRFYRRAGTAETGSGLGLAIAVSIAKRHGASFLLGDTAVGTGLSVSVTFPACTSYVPQISTLKVGQDIKELG